MKKRILALLMAVCMIASLLPVTAMTVFAADETPGPAKFTFKGLADPVIINENDTAVYLTTNGTDVTGIVTANDAWQIKVSYETGKNPTLTLNGAGLGAGQSEAHPIVIGEAGGGATYNNVAVDIVVAADSAVGNSGRWAPSTIVSYITKTLKITSNLLSDGKTLAKLTVNDLGQARIGVSAQGPVLLENANVYMTNLYNGSSWNGQLACYLYSAKGGITISGGELTIKTTNAATSSYPTIKADNGGNIVVNNNAKVTISMVNGVSSHAVFNVVNTGKIIFSDATVSVAENGTAKVFSSAEAPVIEGYANGYVATADGNEYNVEDAAANFATYKSFTIRPIEPPKAQFNFAYTTNAMGEKPIVIEQGDDPVYLKTVHWGTHSNGSQFWAATAEGADEDNYNIMITFNENENPTLTLKGATFCVSDYDPLCTIRIGDETNADSAVNDLDYDIIITEDSTLKHWTAYSEEHIESHTKRDLTIKSEGGALNCISFAHRSHAPAGIIHSVGDVNLVDANITMSNTDNATTTGSSFLTSQSGNITISGGSFTATTAAATGCQNMAILNAPNGAVTIENGAVVNITVNSNATGIKTANGATVKDSTLSIKVTGDGALYDTKPVADFTGGKYNLSETTGSYSVSPYARPKAHFTFNGHVRNGKPTAAEIIEVEITEGDADKHFLTVGGVVTAEGASAENYNIKITFNENENPKLYLNDAELTRVMEAGTYIVIGKNATATEYHSKGVDIIVESNSYMKDTGNGWCAPSLICYNNGDLTITGGWLELNAQISGNNAIRHDGQGSIVLQNAKLVMYSGWSGVRAGYLYAPNGNVTITDSTVELYSGASGTKDYNLVNAGGNIAVTDSSLTVAVSRSCAAFDATGTITFTDSSLKAVLPTSYGSIFTKQPTITLDGVDVSSAVASTTGGTAAMNYPVSADRGVLVIGAPSETDDFAVTDYATYKYINIYAHNHSYSEATCTAPESCYCGATKGEALGHQNTTTYEGKDATCEEDGYTASVYCSDCKTWIVEQETIEAPGHEYDDEFDATCKNCTHIREDALTAVAQVGDKKYASLADAIADVDNGGKVTLLTEVNLTEAVVIAKDVTLDLAGNTITANGDWAVKITAGKVTITGEGTIISDQTAVGVLNGELIIENGTYTTTGDGWGFNVAAIYAYSEFEGEATIVINGGTINGATGDNYALRCCNGTITVTGGNINGANNACCTGVMNIEGGIFSSDDKWSETEADILYAENPACGCGKGVVNVTGGSFKDQDPANASISDTEKTSYVAAGKHTTVEGGYYVICSAAAKDPVEAERVEATCTEDGYVVMVTYCTCGKEISRVTETLKAAHTAGEPKKENYVAPTYDAEGSYNEVVYCSVCGEKMSTTPVVVPAKTGAAAKVGGTSYKTLAEAIAAANGAEITLLKNLVIDGLTIEGNVVINLGNYYIAVNTPVEKTNAAVKITGTLTLNGTGRLTIVGDNRDQFSTLVLNEGILNVNGVTLRGHYLAHPDVACYTVENTAGATANINSGETTVHPVNGLGTITKGENAIVLIPEEGYMWDESGKLVAHEHNYVASVVGATAEARGYVHHECSCGDSYNDGYFYFEYCYAIVNNTVGYRTLQDAIDNASGAEITLLKNFVSDGLTIKGNVVINLGDKYIAVNTPVSGTNAAVKIASTGTLTLNGTGRLTIVGENRAQFGTLILNEGILNVNGVTLRGNYLAHPDAGAYYTVENTAGATANIISGETTVHPVNGVGTITKGEDAIVLIPEEGYLWDESGKLVAHEHNYVASVVGATAEARGYVHHECSCGDSKNDGYFSFKYSYAIVNGTVGYRTLQDALKNAQNGDTIKIFRHFSGSTLVIKKNITIDLGGCSYTATTAAADTAAVVKIESGATLTLTGSGKLSALAESKTEFDTLIQNEGNLVVDGDVTLRGTYLDKFDVCYIVSDMSKVEFKSGNVIVNNNGTTNNIPEAA